MFIQIVFKRKGREERANMTSAPSQFRLPPAMLMKCSTSRFISEDLSNPAGEEGVYPL